MDSKTNNARGFLFWATLVGLVFFTVYPACNWLSAQRDTVHRFYFAWELGIPLVPEFLWAYLSMYVLFVLPPFFLDPVRQKRLALQLISGTLAAGLIFLMFPSTLGFTRAIPGSSFYDGPFRFMFSVDQPYNMWPSLHVVYSALILLALIDRAPPVKWQAGAWFWLALISVSTILVHQHHLLDIFSAYILVGVVRLAHSKGG